MAHELCVRSRGHTVNVMGVTQLEKHGGRSELNLASGPTFSITGLQSLVLLLSMWGLAMLWSSPLLGGTCDIPVFHPLSAVS